MSLIGGENTAQSQKGGSGNTQIVGMDPQLFVQEMRRKDAQIDALIAEKQALSDKVSALEQAALRAEIDALRAEKQGLQARLAAPDQAYAEHLHRGQELAALLDDAATMQAIGENRIRSALAGFSQLDYAEIDALLKEVGDRSLIVASQAFYGRGMIAEDALKWQDAYAHYKQAAGLNESLPVMEAYGRMTWRLGKGAEAERVNRRVLEMIEAVSGRHSRAYASQLNNLALAMNSVGQTDVAAALCRDALELHQRIGGANDLDVATDINNLASIFEAQDKLVEAEALFRKSLKIARVTIGKKHPAFAVRLNNLANVVRKRGKPKEAISLYRQAVDISRKAIGEIHPDFGQQTANLASCLHELGDDAEAERLFRQALDIGRQTIGESHPDFAMRTSNYAHVLVAMERPDDAGPLFLQTLRTFESVLPERHDLLRDARKNLAKFEKRFGAVRPG